MPRIRKTRGYSSLAPPPRKTATVAQDHTQLTNAKYIGLVQLGGRCSPEMGCRDPSLDVIGVPYHNARV